MSDFAIDLVYKDPYHIHIHARTHWLFGIYIYNVRSQRFLRQDCCWWCGWWFEHPVHFEMLHTIQWEDETPWSCPYWKGRWVWYYGARCSWPIHLFGYTVRQRLHLALWLWWVLPRRNTSSLPFLHATIRPKWCGCIWYVCSGTVWYVQWIVVFMWERGRFETLNV